MIILVLYGLCLAYGSIIWLSYKLNTTQPANGKVSIITVVRNEANNIENLLRSIQQQTYKNIEVLIVDDQSTDQTSSIIKNLNYPNVEILPLLESERGNTPKKSGITKAIAKAKGDYIFTTDGDCILPPKLIATYVSFMQQPDIQGINGPVTFFKNNKVWNQIQTVEFASLIGTSALAAFQGKPIMSSAANFMYRKHVFQELGGYEGSFHLASGDDEYLMNRIQMHYPKGILYAKHSECVVETASTPSLKAFFQQRKRWAGKWNQSINWTSKLVAILVFLINAVTIYYLAKGEWLLLLFRFIPEFVFLTLVLVFLKRKTSIIYIPITQLLYPFYAVFFGIISCIPSNYTWKDRKLK